MTTFYPPELVRSTGTLTVEKAVITPLTGVATVFDLNTDKAAIGILADINMIGEDSLAAATTYGRIRTNIVDPTTATQDGNIALDTMVAGALATRATFASGLAMAGATGGDQGGGTVNATNYYINGVAIANGAGDVVGPASATDNALARYDAATGKLIQNSLVIVDDLGNVTGVNDMTVTGDLTVNGTTTTVNTTTLSVEDSLLQLGNGNLTTDVVDLGMVGLYDTSGSLNLYAGFFRDASDNKFKMFVDSQEDLAVANVVNIAATGYTVATLVANLEGDVTGQVSDLSNHDTDDLTEGTTNKYASTANVNTAGAVMETDYNAFTVLAADVDDTPLPVTMGPSTMLARLAAGGIVAASVAQILTLLGVTAGAEPNLDWNTSVLTGGAGFTAGVSTTLTMPVAAPGDDEDHVTLSYDGVVQTVDDFTISGTTMTVSVIPVGVTKIMIRVLA